MTKRTRFTASEVLNARQILQTLSVDDMLAKGFIDISAVLSGDFTYEVVITRAGEKKIQVIKEIRALTKKGLQDAKEIADNGGLVLETESRAGADKARSQIAKIGFGVDVEVRRVKVEA